MKKIYCEKCGLELENGLCPNCSINNSKNKKNNSNIHKICPSCKLKNDEDALFCAYCGLPFDVEIDKHLQKELVGIYSTDVIDYYNKLNNKKDGIADDIFGRKSVIRVLIVCILTIVVILLTTKIIVPIMNNMKIRNELLNDETIESGEITSIDSTTSIMETTESSQKYLDLKDKWVKQDGYIYAFDKDGNPVVDEWIEETDDNGDLRKYYFDVDGKLVVNSWIDGEFYVGSDGAMLVDADTPDGAHVDEDGHVVVELDGGVKVDGETKVYYEKPGDTETKVASNQKSANSGIIKGVDKDKTYQLYVRDVGQKRETIESGSDKCNIIFYKPIIDGSDEREVEVINKLFEEKYNTEFKEMLVTLAKSKTELPKSITMNQVQQRTLNENRYLVIVSGRLLPRHGLYEKHKYRFVFDRKSQQLLIKDITE